MNASNYSYYACGRSACNGVVDVDRIYPETSMRKEAFHGL